MPSRTQTCLLQACLLSGEPANLAWTEWLGRVHDPYAYCRDDRCGVNRVLPLLFESIRRNALAVDRQWYTCLKTARLRESLRSATYEDILAALLDKLSRLDIPVLVTGGAALAASEYAEPGLRHCHEIEIVVREADLCAVLAAVATAGNGDAPNGDDTHPITVYHKSGVPLDIHSGRLGGTPGAPTFADLWRRSRMVDTANGRMRIPGLHDAILYMLAKKWIRHDRDAYTWVCDAWMSAVAADFRRWEDIHAGRTNHNHPKIHSMLNYLEQHFPRGIKTAAPTTSTLAGRLLEYVDE